MQDVVRRYSDELRRAQGVEVQIRVGLNSGEVVVRSIGSDLRMDYSAVGQTTNLAARMEQLAAPGSIRLTAETLHLAEGFVQVTPLGPVPVKVLAEPVEVFELVGAGAQGRRAVGGRGDAGIIRRMLGQHPNLLCELSQRDDRPLPNPEVRQRGMITDDARQLKADWKALLEDHSDRFLVGTDSAKPEHYQGIIDFFRAVLVQLTPDAARRLAHGNALRVFRLAQ